MEIKYRLILGSFELLSSEEGIVDDGDLAQRIAEILVKELTIYGVEEVDIDFEKAVILDNMNITKEGDLIKQVNELEEDRINNICDNCTLKNTEGACATCNLEEE
jgi:hypothetical protein